jgi:hypothetical protein
MKYERALSDAESFCPASDAAAERAFPELNSLPPLALPA